MTKIKFIDSEEEYHQVLYDLRLLDDDDDYPLYSKMVINDSYDTQEFPIDYEVEQYIIDNELYTSNYNTSGEYVYVKNHNTKEIYMMSQQIYLKTQNMLSLEQELTIKEQSIQVKKL